MARKSRISRGLVFIRRQQLQSRSFQSRFKVLEESFCLKVKIDSLVCYWLFVSHSLRRLANENDFRWRDNGNIER